MIGKTERKFSDLKLDKWILKNIDYLRYEKPTLIQENIIPKILAGENVIGIANTGTGKTAAFCLPILKKLAIDPSGMFAIILEPSRELAVQVLEKLKVFSAGFNLRVSLIIGGMDITEQLHKLDQIPHIVNKLLLKAFISKN
jgi:ATP-dependent RNA helicase DDX49/DBP8